MTGSPFSLILELVVAGLLMVTVGYCFVLNRRLKRLRSAQDDLREVIRDLNVSTEHAERAIAGLKVTSQEVERQLSDKLQKAKLLTHNLALFVEKGDPNRNDIQVTTAAPAAWSQSSS